MMASDRSRRRERRFLEDSLHRGPRASARRGRGPRRRFRWPRFVCGGSERRQWRSAARARVRWSRTKQREGEASGREEKHGESREELGPGGLLILPSLRHHERVEGEPHRAPVRSLQRARKKMTQGVQLPPLDLLFYFIQVLFQFPFLF